MKSYYFLLLVLSFTAVQSQVFDRMAFSTAYRYTGRNVIQGGLSYKMNNSTNQSLILGTSVLYSSVDGEAKFLPEASFYYTNRMGHLFGVSLNPYSIEPRIGLSLFNFMNINTGFALPIHKEKYFKGITFGIQFNIAPVKSSQFYEKMKLMQ
ncbi:hypothetical protein CEY12_05360 [Chryseobacterium sp. T16E-39]|uniref:hypothetical protein n=1 Tax=Chryseobacterium sp. T16E-39 TaxID=2015076 RepID=UPI000B5B1847|nr:hypothetical protein [Chryseobacterium sp. T16E-39]ASK29567.1 hypothetical protein CEY12_05360 [Chryseobacterium sp. T16E-39]